MMPSTAIVDAGALLASLDDRDANHRGSAAVLGRRDLQFVVPALVVAEVAYLANRRRGPMIEARFVRALHRFEVEGPTPDEWPAIADLVERYANFPIGTTDAATIVLADRYETDLIVTLDRRHFSAVQSPKGRRFRLLPDQVAVHEEPAIYEPTAP